MFPTKVRQKIGEIVDDVFQETKDVLDQLESDSSLGKNHRHALPSKMRQKTGEIVDDVFQETKDVLDQLESDSSLGNNHRHHPLPRQIRIQCSEFPDGVQRVEMRYVYYQREKDVCSGESNHVIGILKRMLRELSALDVEEGKSDTKTTKSSSPPRKSKGNKNKNEYRHKDSKDAGNFNSNTYAIMEMNGKLVNAKTKRSEICRKLDKIHSELHKGDTGHTCHSGHFYNSEGTD